MYKRQSWVTEQRGPVRQCLHVWEVPVFTERTSVGLDVHARSVVATAIDGVACIRDSRGLPSREVLFGSAYMCGRSRCLLSVRVLVWMCTHDPWSRRRLTV